jgi:hypothetical protein
MNEVIRFFNNDLNFDIEKILSFDRPLAIAKDFDDNLDYPFVLDVQDTSYFYVNSLDRDSDYDALIELLNTTKN